MTQKELANKLLEIREKKGISKYKLWKNGMNTGTVIAVEEGKNVTIETLIKDCDIVGAEIVVKEKEEH